MTSESRKNIKLDTVSVEEASPSPWRLVQLIATGFKPQLWLAWGLSTVSAMFAMLLPWALGKVIHAVTQSDSGTMHSAIAIFTAVAAIELITSRFYDGVQVRTRPKMRQATVAYLYKILQKRSHKFHIDHLSGSLSHKVNETAQGVAQAVWLVLGEFWPLLITLVMAVVLLMQAHVGLGVFFTAWATAFVGISWYFAKRSQEWARKAAHARSRTNGLLLDTLVNQVNVRLFVREFFERQMLTQAQAAELTEILTANRFTEKVRWFQNILALVLKVVILLLAVYLWKIEQIGLSAFVMAVMLSFPVINETRNLGKRLLDLFEALGSVANGAHTVLDPASAGREFEGERLKVTDGCLEWCNVDFGYEPGRLIFKNLSIKIPSGQRVGLVGLSGSGKTTFVNLLLRLFDPVAGSILIDGNNIATLDPSSLREAIAYVPQEPVLFHRSLRENIAYGALQASDAEIVSAAQKAHAHAFIASLPQGYDALVGERGVKLSGGQRQRVALARALLKESPIWVMDEATSALDSITERALRDTLRDHVHGKTVIVIAHRLTTIAHLDRIVVLDHGNVVEDGSHADLLARKGLYSRMWEKQVDGLLPEVLT